jgi:hypothetical protein
MHNISYDYARNEMYSHEARLREAQRNGTAYLKPERKAAMRRHWFALHRAKPAAPRYIPATGAR